MLWVGVIAHPTAEWIARQLTEAGDWEQPPKYLTATVMAPMATSSNGAFAPWAFAISQPLRARRARTDMPPCDRLIGSLRRECLNHIVILGERHLRYVLFSYLAITVALELISPCARTRRSHAPGTSVDIRSTTILGGLHHQYGRI